MPRASGRRRTTGPDGIKIGVVAERTDGVADCGIDRAPGTGRDPTGHLECLEEQWGDPNGSAGLGMEHGQLGVFAEPAAGQVDLIEGPGEDALGDIGPFRILHDHGGRGPDRPQRSDREPRVGRGRRAHREVPPDVTVGLDEVEEGADVVEVVELEDDPASSDDDVDAPLVVGVVRSPDETETPPLEVVVVAEEAGTLDPDVHAPRPRPSRAVAPVAASTAPRVTRRRRDCALALLWGLCVSGGRDIDQSTSARGTPPSDHGRFDPGSGCAVRFL